MSKLTAKVFYMRDNHTFVELDINNIDASIGIIIEEYGKGFTAGMLCSKHECAPEPIHANKYLFDFINDATAWFGKFRENIEKKLTAREYVDDMMARCSKVQS